MFSTFTSKKDQLNIISIKDKYLFEYLVTIFGVWTTVKYSSDFLKVTGSNAKTNAIFSFSTGDSSQVMGDSIRDKKMEPTLQGRYQNFPPHTLNCVRHWQCLQLCNIDRQLNKTNTTSKSGAYQACQAKSVIQWTSACLYGTLLNCPSTINKPQDVQLEVTTNDLDFCALTRTWLKVEDNVTPLSLCPSGYNIFQYLERLNDVEV